jgi:hypothetical protein
MILEFSEVSLVENFVTFELGWKDISTSVDHNAAFTTPLQFTGPERRDVGEYSKFNGRTKRRNSSLGVARQNINLRHYWPGDFRY